MGAVIGLDARMVDCVPSGLGTYGLHLIRTLTALDRENSYVVIRRPDGPSSIASGPNVQEVTIGGDLSSPVNLFQGRAISRLGLDLYHSLHHFLPIGLRVQQVVLTLHDLIWVEHPRLIRRGRFGAIEGAAIHAFARVAIAHAVRRADRIVAVSAHTRSRALARYHIDPARIIVVHHGVDHQTFRPGDEATPASPRYFLCLGNSRPYKNLEVALQAFAMCAGRDADLRLVVAGRGDAKAALEGLASVLGIGARVRFTECVEEREVVRLLHGATALILPSLVEGFGLPALEAMAAGCPVITSNAATLVEVAGDAALVVDPHRPADVAEAMGRLLADPELRADLRARGLARAALFTWERAAAATRAVQQALIGRGSEARVFTSAPLT